MRNILDQTVAGVEDLIQPGGGEGFPKAVKRLTELEIVGMSRKQGLE